MKTKLIKPKKQFNPITVEITVETKREAEFIACYLGQDRKTLAEVANNNNSYIEANEFTEHEDATGSLIKLSDFVSKALMAIQ